MAQPSSQSIKAVFQAINRGQPIRQCLSQQKVSLLCITRKCKASSCYCLDRRCSDCWVPHKFCECVQVASLTELLKKIAERHQQFSERLAKTTEELIEQIRKKMQKLEEDTYQSYFSAAQLEIIESIYLSKPEVELSGDKTKTFYRKVIETHQQVETLQSSVQETFEKEAKKVLSQLKKFVSASTTKFSEKFGSSMSVNEKIMVQHSDVSKSKEKMREKPIVKKEPLEGEDMRMDEEDIICGEEKPKKEENVEPNVLKLEEKNESEVERREQPLEEDQEVDFEKELEERQKQLTEMKKVVAALKGELQKMKEVKYLFGLEKSKTQQLEKTSKTLRQTIYQLTTKKQEQNKKNTDAQKLLQQENSQLKKELKQIKQKQIQSDNEISQFEQETSQLKEELQRFKQENTQFKKELKQIKQEKIQSDNEISKFENQIQKLKQEKARNDKFLEETKQLEVKYQAEEKTKQFYQDSYVLIYALANNDYSQQMVDMIQTYMIDLLRTKVIEKKESLDNNIRLIYYSLQKPKAMKLLFRASQNGFLAQKFHKSCDGKVNTFTLIRTEFGKIIGGFTPVKWESPQNGICKEDTSKKSFLLSFDLCEKMMITQTNKAIYCQNNLGPTFGESPSKYYSNSSDISICNKCNIENENLTNFPRSYSGNNKYNQNQETYTKFCGSSNSSFKVMEYQVFQVFW